MWDKRKTSVKQNSLQWGLEYLYVRIYCELALTWWHAPNKHTAVLKRSQCAPGVQFQDLAMTWTRGVIGDESWMSTLWGQIQICRGRQLLSKLAGNAAGTATAGVVVLSRLWEMLSLILWSLTVVPSNLGRNMNHSWKVTHLFHSVLLEKRFLISWTKDPRVCVGLEHFCRSEDLLMVYL